jgi:2-(1,2-epoxy-1,2-dihydrophenyl)acetyl-CoA isomerase
MSDRLLIQRSNASITVTLNRPHRRNAIDLALRSELADVLERLSDDDGLHSLVLRGAGPVFCAGGDVHELADVRTRDAADHRLREGNRMATALISFPVPTIAVLQGTAAGAGASLALACDVVVPVSGASIRCSFGHLGLAPDAGASFLLQRLGAFEARRLALTSGSVSAERLVTLGVADRTLDSEQIDAEIDRLVGLFAELSRSSLVATKRLLATGPASVNVALDDERLAQLELLGGPDFARRRERVLGSLSPASIRSCDGN